MTPHQVFEASKLIEDKLRLEGVKAFVNPDEPREHDAVLRSASLLEFSRYLGRAALIKLDKPHGLNSVTAEWLYIISYHEEFESRRPSVASVTIFPEREPYIFTFNNSLAGDAECILEDLRLI